MHTPSISFSFSFLNNLTQSFRIFLVTSITGTYTLILYELFPEFLFNPNYSLTYFVAPVAAIAGVLIGLPKFMNRGVKTAKPKAKKTENKSGEDLLNEIISGDDSGESTQQGVQQDSTGVMAGNSEGVTLEPASVGGPNAELDALLGGGESNSSTVSADVVTSGGSISGLNEDTIRDMIDQKFEPVEKDLSSFKKDLNKIKEDMKITKENVDSLTESFEGTLTDMKAFQAEIANPLNFMRKYFESIDLKNLSDPSLPLRQQNRAPEQTVSQAPIPQPASQAPVSAPQPAPVSAPVPEPAPQTSSQPQPKPKTTEMESIEKGTDLDNPMDSVMKPLFSGTLSVSNLMSIVELAGEMLKENGDDCIDLLIEQCKLMGLKDEDENTIYNIIDMLKKSGMNVEDTLIQLYKFAKIVGINDKQADAHYKKLLESRDEEDE